MLIFGLSSTADAQTVRLSGFVTDTSSGQALEGATVALYTVDQRLAGPPAFGRATTSEGFYLMSGIPAGRYLLEISFVGYESYEDTLRLAAYESRIVTVSLEPSAENLEDILVESERLHGAARVTAGHQRITPEEIELIPAPDVSGDLAGYLTTLPGVITPGDRGGQFFVRGGAPTQNLVQLDGMIVYQPFHVLGSYSVFPADVVDRVDFYAGGFGAEYGGRLSSVLDVAARPGNNRRFGGMASASPFTGALQLEGPIIPRRASFLVSARESFIHQIGEPVYGEKMPFEFSDLFAKIQALPGPGHRLSAAAFRSYDRGTIGAEIDSQEAQDISWSNSGASLRWLLLPRSFPVAAEITLSRSRHEMQQGTGADTVRSTQVRNTRIALDATFTEGSLFGGRSTTSAGWEVVFGRTDNELGYFFRNVEDRGMGITTFAVYVEPELSINGITVQPGLRMQTYNVRHLPYLEPRIRAKLTRGIHQLSAAFGLYHQHVVGLNDRRDAASVFTAWSGVPRVNDRPPRVRNVTPIAPNTWRVTIPLNAALESIGGELIRGRLGRSVHALMGYNASPAAGIEFAVEGFYKHLTNLFVGEITALSGLTTRLLPATGRSTGFEVRLELRRDPVYAYATYGLSNTVYEADGRSVSLAYETERLRYRPAHDRRHQFNAVFSTSIKGVDLNARWHFGSGLPFTQPRAFDGFVLIDDMDSAFEHEAFHHVIYDEPFGALLPTYHRLDISASHSWDARLCTLTLQASALNVYDRRNIFYVDTYTLARKDQLPFVPSLGLKISFD